MRHEKIFKREDGTQVQISITLSVETYRDSHRYEPQVRCKYKGKRTWISPLLEDTFKFTTPQEIQEVALELWEQLKPKFI